MMKEFVFIPLALVLVGLLVPLVRLEFDDMGVRILFLLAYLLCAGGLLRNAVSARLGFLDLLFWVFTLGMIVVPGAIQVSWGAFAWPAAHTHADLIRSLYLLDIGLVMYFIAGFAQRRAPPKSSGLVLSDAWPLRRLVLLLILPGVVAVIWIGPANLFIGRYELNRIVDSAAWKSQLFMLGRSLMLVAWIVALGSFVNTFRAKRNAIGSGLLLISVGLLTFSMINPVSSARFWFLGLLVGTFIVIFCPLNSLAKAIFLPASVAFFLLIMGPLKSLAGSGSFRVSISSLMAEDRIKDYLLTTDFDSFQMYLNTIATYSTLPFRGGYNFLGAIFFWIPRSVWPSKPEDTGAITSWHSGYEYLNVGCPLYGELYAGFGLLGIVAGMFLLGWWVLRLDEGIAFYSKGAPRILGHVVNATIGAFFVILLRGSLNGVVPQFGFAVVFVLMVTIFPQLRRWAFGITWRATARTRRPPSPSVQRRFRSDETDRDVRSYV